MDPWGFLVNKPGLIGQVANQCESVLKKTKQKKHQVGWPSRSKILQG